MLFPRGSGFQEPQIETKRALLLLDFQNDFVSSKGHLHVPNIVEFLPKLVDLVEAFRANDHQVVWANTQYTEPRPVISPYVGGHSILLKENALHLQRLHDRNGIEENGTISPRSVRVNSQRRAKVPAPSADPEAFLSAKLPDSYKRCCVPNSTGAALPTKLSEIIDPRDIVLTKTEYSALGDPALLMQLRMRLVTDLYICGSLSNVAVYATVLDAARNGFGVFLVEDCLGYRNEVCHVEAMREMADRLGAEGIDVPELLDDLAGLLGDVVDESQFTRSFQLSIGPQGHNPSTRRSQRVKDWVASIEDGSLSEKLEKSEKLLGSANMTHKAKTPEPTNGRHRREPSSPGPKPARTSPSSSPSRKRSLSEHDGVDGPSDIKPTKKPSVRRTTSSTPKTTSTPGKKQNRRSAAISPLQTKDHSALKALASINSGMPAASLGMIEVDTDDNGLEEEEEVLDLLAITTAAHFTRHADIKVRRPKSKAKTYLGPGDVIGAGDCSLMPDVMDNATADVAFSKIRDKTIWQKMYHRTGEVPRLVAVQGTISGEGEIPIYRHPADESPELLTFDENIQPLRAACEKVVGHPLNHVLIQYYRNGDDNISEHSDKTLDIVYGSKIVNLSLGATRTMTLRTKKDIKPKQPHTDQDCEAEREEPNLTERTTQHIHLTHNSIFVLGPCTNTNWLHSIRADKRPDCEKSDDEKAFDGERISLTFRQIGTFINTKQNTIWGQGATSKTRDAACSILSGTMAAQVGEEMIVGFGKENHLKKDSFDWDEVYGRGFDVVNFTVKSGV